MTSRRVIGRRTFLKATAGGAAAAGLGVAARAAAPAARRKDRPNIVVIMSDEHNAGVTGCYGNSIVRTPNLDRLAERGITFNSFYCNSPLCVPSRMAFTAGKYISRTGAWNNSCWLPSDGYPSIARAMNAAGYDSLLCGKMHYDGTRRYGFTEIGGNMNSSFKTGKGGRRKPDDLPGDPNKLSARFDDFHAGDSRILAHDRQVTAGVIDFLARRRRADGPFFLVAGYLAPHFPLIVPQAYWDAYKGRVPMPEIPEGHLDALPLNYQHLRAGFKNWHVPPEIVNKGRELYHGLTQWFDEQVGVVLSRLAQTSLADNTIVIYTSDHGENMGEHGLWWKNCMYEHAARVPLVVSWPRRWTGSQQRTEACSSSWARPSRAPIGTVILCAPGWTRPARPGKTGPSASITPTTSPPATPCSAPAGTSTSIIPAWTNNTRPAASSTTWWPTRASSRTWPRIRPTQRGSSRRTPSSSRSWAKSRTKPSFAAGPITPKATDEASPVRQKAAEARSNSGGPVAGRYGSSLWLTCKPTSRAINTIR